jgi:C4-type Zn-finger protein
MAKPKPDDARRYSCATRLRCPMPNCRSTDLRTTKTVESTPQVVIRRVKCRKCGHTFIGVIE